MTAAYKVSPRRHLVNLIKTIGHITGILYAFYPINPQIIINRSLKPYMGTNLKSEVSFRSEILNP